MTVWAFVVACVSAAAAVWSVWYSRGQAHAAKEQAAAAEKQAHSAAASAEAAQLQVVFDAERRDEERRDRAAAAQQNAGALELILKAGIDGRAPAKLQVLNNGSEPFSDVFVESFNTDSEDGLGVGEIDYLMPKAGGVIVSLAWGATTARVTYTDTGRRRWERWPDRPPRELTDEEFASNSEARVVYGMARRRSSRGS